MIRCLVRIRVRDVDIPRFCWRLKQSYLFVVKDDRRWSGFRAGVRWSLRYWHIVLINWMLHSPLLTCFKFGLRLFGATAGAISPLFAFLIKSFFQSIFSIVERNSKARRMYCTLSHVNLVLPSPLASLDSLFIFLPFRVDLCESVK